MMAGLLLRLLCVIERMRHCLLQCLSLGVTGMVIPAFADSIDTSDQAPYEQCGYCHEYDGNSRMPQFPKLAGQDKSYLLKQIRDFKAGRRDGKGIMQEAVALLDEQGIQSVAEYFSSQARAAFTQGGEPNQQQRTLAKQIYFKGDTQKNIPACSACHAHGRAEIPYLIGQHQQYLQTQLLAFKQQTRKNDEAAVMRDIAAQLDDVQIRALSAYLAAAR